MEADRGITQARTDPDRGSRVGWSQASRSACEYLDQEWGHILEQGDSTATTATDENSPIPESWTWARRHSRIISVFIIIGSSFVIFIPDILFSTKEVDEFVKEIYPRVRDRFGEQLDQLLKDLLDEYDTSYQMRAYFILAVRRKWCPQWHLRIRCHDSQLDQEALLAELRFNEGGPGHAFMTKKIVSKSPEASNILLKDASHIPAGYRHLDEKNKRYMKGGADGYLVTSVYYREALVGLLVLDTKDDNDLQLFQDPNFASKMEQFVSKQSDLISIVVEGTSRDVSG